MIHDFCLLKKTQESLLARAYKDSCNVVVFISCTDTRLFYAVGTLINEPLELLYLNVISFAYNFDRRSKRKL